jgi:hypothetical protein
MCAAELRGSYWRRGDEKRKAKSEKRKAKSEKRKAKSEKRKAKSVHHRGHRGRSTEGTEKRAELDRFF